MLLDLLFADFTAGGLPGYAFLSDSGNQLEPGSFTINGINKYMIGNLVVLSVKFTDINMNPIDPSIIRLFVRSPDYSEVEYIYGASAITRDGAGLYHFNLPNTQSGYYNYRWEGDGSIIAASDSQIDSISSVFDM